MLYCKVVFLANYYEEAETLNFSGYQ